MPMLKHFVNKGFRNFFEKEVYEIERISVHRRTKNYRFELKKISVSGTSHLLMRQKTFNHFIIKPVER